MVPSEAIVDALPFLQRAALDPTASRTLRGRKAHPGQRPRRGSRATGVEVPKLIEPRRISWINLALVLGTLIGGWALIGVLVNVTQSWSTITGADWGWVAVVFVLAQAAYPALALTTVGSVTDTMPYGRTVALEVSNTFVALAGGSMGALATRVRFFQQQGYDATLAVSSGVLISTASWITKGALFLIAIPIAISQFDFADSPASTGGGSGSSTAKLVWIIIIAVVVIGVVLGLVLAIPRWRRLAAAKLRPKASEVWGHLKLLSNHPRNLVEIFGGEVVAQLLVAMALGAALHAFNQHMGLASLLIVLTLGSMIGGLSPVPGGMGVVEAGMILCLTAAGIPRPTRWPPCSCSGSSPPTCRPSGAGSAWSGCASRSTCEGTAGDRPGRPDQPSRRRGPGRSSPSKSRSRPKRPNRPTLTPMSAARSMRRSPRLLP